MVDVRTTPSVDAIARKLQGFIRRLGNLSGAGDDVHEIIEQETEKVFRTEDGGRWPPLAPSTVARKAPGSRPLEASGVLRHSLGGRGPGSIRTARGNRVTFGTSLRYARVHHGGSAHLPQRRLLPDVRDRSFGKKVARAYEQELVDVSAGLVERS